MRSFKHIEHGYCDGSLLANGSTELLIDTTTDVSPHDHAHTFIVYYTYVMHISLD